MSTPAAMPHNPFHQPPAQHILTLEVPQGAVMAVESVFEDLALSVSSFEIPERKTEWKIEILLPFAPEAEEITRRMKIAEEIVGITLPTARLEPLSARDWVSEIQQSFPAFQVGRYFVHGSHVEAFPPSAIPLCVDAGMAFGTGEHATTQGCLIALDGLAKRRRFTRMLDMGTGTGILAIAMEKTWKHPVLAVDIDPMSVAVAAENCTLNRASGVRTGVSDGYASPLVREAAPYDLIVANILARPLMMLAKDLARHLLPGGVAVLSGLLAEQEAMVLFAHRAQGMRLLKRIPIHGWHTLVLGR